MELSELLPHIGGIADEITLVRSMTTDSVDHEAALRCIHTGKVLAGRPVLEGPLATPMRGHMPVFNYLNRDEATDVYLYLSAYPPQQ